MLEKRFAAISPQLFAASGTTSGVATIPDSSLFKVKQVVIVASSTQPNLELEVKKVQSPTQIVLGPRTGNIFATADISAYTTTDSAYIFANEQKRPTITADEFERATYEEEPTVAKRTILVDEFGNKITTDNPLPTSATINVPPINVDTVGQGAPAVNADAWPVKVSDGVDTVGVSTVGAAKALKVDVLQSGFVPKSTTFAYNVNGDMETIETIIGSKKRIEQFTYNGQGDLVAMAVTVVDV